VVKVGVFEKSPSMHNKRFLACALVGLLTHGWWADRGWSQEVVTPRLPATNTDADVEALDRGAEAERVWSVLTDLGRGVRDLDKTKDNVFVYEAEKRRLEELGASLIGDPVEVTLRVQRVSKHEVIVDVPDAGPTRVVMRHASPPEFGNLCTVQQVDGYSSTAWYHQFALPFAIRIGSEIDLGLASQLRRQDPLLLRGQIISLVIRTESVFRPVTVATIGNWQVVDGRQDESVR
jgi:hypothetical protein